MSKAHRKSVHTTMSIDNPPPKYEAKAKPIPSMPADYSDPNHPHTGDIEGQSAQLPVRKSTPSKRLIWMTVLGVLFLFLLAISMGLGYWYGRTQIPNEYSPASSPIIVTATTATITQTSTIDQLGMVTVTQVKPVFGTHTATTFVYPGPGVGKGTPAPFEAPIHPIETNTPNAVEARGENGEDKCFREGRWGSDKECMEHCKRIDGLFQTGCTNTFGVYECWHCR